MDYRRVDDQLFGKYCYIDTPWIAGKKTIYRIIRSGVQSNVWCEVPVNGHIKNINHGKHSEEIVFVMLDTLIDEDTKIMRFALKDVEIIEAADRKTEPKDESQTVGEILVPSYHTGFIPPFEPKDEPQTDRLVQTNVIELPDTHQKVVFEREITEEDGCIKIGEWKYKGFEEE